MDHVILQREAIQIVLAAGPEPDLDAIADVQRLVGRLPSLTANSSWGSGDDASWVGSPTRILGRFVTRYALGEPAPYLPPPATTFVPAVGTRLSRGTLSQWMRARGIVGVRADVLQLAFANWHVTQANLSALAALPTGMQIATGAGAYVIPAPDRRPPPDVVHFDFALPLTPGSGPDPFQFNPLEKGAIFATELAAFAPAGGFFAAPTYDALANTDDVASPPAAAWVEALDPSTETGVSLRIVSALFDLVTVHHRVYVERSYFKKQRWDESFVDPQFSSISTSRYAITAARLKHSLPGLLPAPRLTHGPDGAWDSRRAVELEDDNGTFVGRADLGIFAEPSSELVVAWARPRTALRLPSGEYVTLGAGHPVLARDTSFNDEQIARGVTLASLGGAPATGPSPSSFEAAIHRAPTPLPQDWTQDPIFFGGHRYTSWGYGGFYEDDRCMVPAGIDFYGTTLASAPSRLFWVGRQSTAPSDEWEQVEDARGLIAFDLSARTWLRYLNPRWTTTATVPLTGNPEGGWTVETHADGFVLVHAVAGWVPEKSDYGTITTRVDLRGSPEVPVTQGYFTPVMPLFRDGTPLGTLY